VHGRRLTVYPERIAGHRASLRYDNRSRRFTMTWRARPRLDTVIQVPWGALQFAAAGGLQVRRAGRLLLARAAGPVSISIAGR
jgi:hypothetical protein